MRKPLRHHHNHLFHSTSYSGDITATAAFSSIWSVNEFIVEPRELEYLLFEEDLIDRYESFMKEQNNTEGMSMDHARSQGVENEWSSYQFFAQDDVNAPDQLFQYIDDNGEVAFFTEQQQQQISEWTSSSPYPVSGIEGHHVETVKENPTDVELAANPDNILLATREGHRYHLHDGNTQNPTNEIYLDTDIANSDKLTMTLDYNEEIMTVNLWESAGMATLGSAGLYITATMVIEAVRFKRDPRPWNEKQKDAAVGVLTGGLLGAGVGIVGFASATAIQSLIGEFSIVGLESFFGDILEINGTYLAVSLTMAAYTYIKLRQQNRTHEQAMNQYLSMIKVASIEFLVFNALGAGVEIGMDALVDLAVDAVLPDPTGVLIALRMSYSAAKIGKKYLDGKKEKKAAAQCNRIRKEFFYETALNGTRNLELN